jgi:hypothetical protein
MGHSVLCARVSVWMGASEEERAGPRFMVQGDERSVFGMCLRGNQSPELPHLHKGLSLYPCPHPVTLGYYLLLQTGSLQG